MSNMRFIVISTCSGRWVPHEVLGAAALLPGCGVPRRGFFALVRLLLATDGHSLLATMGAQAPTLSWVMHALLLCRRASSAVETSRAERASGGGILTMVGMRLLVTVQLCARFHAPRANSVCCEQRASGMSAAHQRHVSGRSAAGQRRASGAGAARERHMSGMWSHV